MSSSRISHFKNYLESNWVIGEDFNADRPYMPYAKLKEYWSEVRIIDLLSALDPPSIEQIAVIRYDFILSLSIFTFIDRPGLISFAIRSNLRDIRLPCEPDALPPSSLENDWAEFLDNQWFFCPLDFKKQPFDLYVHPQHILPLTSLDTLSGTSRNYSPVRSRKVSIHHGYGLTENHVSITLFPTSCSYSSSACK